MDNEIYAVCLVCGNRNKFTRGRGFGMERHALTTICNACEWPEGYSYPKRFYEVSNVNQIDFTQVKL